MMKQWLLALVLFCIMFGFSDAGAQGDPNVGLTINNASHLKFAIYNNKVYFRNLNDFNPAYKPCCYFYWIDLETPQGLASYSLILSRAASGQKVDLWVPNYASGGLIEQIGIW